MSQIVKTKPTRFDWKLFKAECPDGKIPYAVWGSNNQRRIVVDYGYADNLQEYNNIITTLSECFWTFDSVFYCAVVNGKFESVTSS